MNLLAEIEAFLARTGTTPSRLGWRAVRDKRLVFDMRRGRVPRDDVRGRVVAFMEHTP